MSKKISVVTVCFNSQDTIRMTIESVLSQKYDDFEYIIVDGASTDLTLSIIGEYLDNAVIKMVSEPDKGLYDAMNKATKLAEGDYLCFMNSGDAFVDDMVVADIAGRLSGDITYGNVVRVREDGEHTEKYKGTKMETKWTLLKGRMICHQTMFIKRETMLLYGYDTKYRITADFNMLCRMVKDKKELNYVDRDIARMDNIEGISSDKKNIPVMWKEDDDSIRECFPVWYSLLLPVKMIKRRFF